MQRKYEEKIIDLYNNKISQFEFLDWLYNTAGPFQVQYHVKDKEDNHKCSKWHDWLVARENQFLSTTVNHRTILYNELCFDLDLPKWLNEEERKQVLNMSLRRLKEHYNIFPIVLDTGKGYHLHYFDNTLATDLIIKQNPKRYKQQYAMKILSDIRSDLAKWNPNCMIAIECSKHWKRNNRITWLEVKHEFS